VAEKLDLNCIGFVSKTPNWFFAKAMKGALQAAQPHLKGEVLLYGSSMGAFAALKYSRALSADITISLSPQFSIDPQIAPRTRYKTFFRPDWHTGFCIERDDIGGRCYVVFDPHYQEDKDHFEKLHEYKGIIPIHANFVDHDTVFIVGRTESARRLFSLARADDRMGMFHLFRERKKLEAWSVRSLAVVCQSRGKLNIAASLLDRAATLGLQPPILNHLRFSLLRSRQHLDEAEAIAAREVQQPGHPAERLVEYAEFLFTQKKWAAAAKGFEAALKAGGRSRHLHVRLSQSWRSSGQHASAASVLREALKLWPEDQELLVSLSWAHLASGAHLEAAAGFRAQLAKRPMVASYHSGLIDSLRRSRLMDEAEQAVRQAKALLPDDPQIRRWSEVVLTA
jgi:tetratricopeptide (TPR) repeat protein